ncbi:MAG: hypothetical protein SFU99_11380 [Saprospiraceae bacterium]|nr:hypothetical protein [Saprospiraceae bacterium]
MKKIRKLLKSPLKFFVDSRGVRKIINICIGYKDKQNSKPTALMFRFNDWKTFMYDYMPQYNCVFMPLRNKVKNLNVRHYIKEIEQYKNKTFFIWGYKEPEGLVDYAKNNGIKYYRVEDGFLRSIKLGAERSVPISMCFDSKALYFDAREESDLEHILNNYDFDSNPELLKEAEECKKLIIDLELSKYNNVKKKPIEEIYGVKTKKRILVVGQVEDDASILYGCSKNMNNNDLVFAALLENPDAEIIYKPHPDVLFGKREALSDINDVVPYCKVITEPLSLVDSFQTIDEVYTITSLSGFEALIRGITVTTFGCPFYSGWGLTNDKQPNERRKRKLTINEVFAGAYLLYPKYYSLINREEITLKKAIKELYSLKTAFHNNKGNTTTINTITNDKQRLKEEKNNAKKTDLEFKINQIKLLKEKQDALLERRKIEIEEIKLDIIKRKEKLKSNSKKTKQ